MEWEFRNRRDLVQIKGLVAGKIKGEGLTCLSSKRDEG